jgi:predicted amidohydrolase
MKICIAQIKSIRGQVQTNIENHLAWVERAIQLKSDVIIFPELSISNYEPELAQALATNVEDPIFIPFQKLADKDQITIGAGMPTKAKNGIHISMLIFKPNVAPAVYSKQMLHADELPCFVEGNTQTILDFNGIKIGLGICYETLQREHFVNAKKLGANIYVASVAKPKGGVEKAYEHFPKIADEFKIPILMSNCIGPCDNFISLGQSAAWNKNGEILGRLNGENEGLLVYDTKTQAIKVKI